MSEKMQLRALVVEDSVGDAYAIGRHLSESEIADFEITTAVNVDQARNHLVKDTFELGILDHRLPDGTAEEVLEIARELELNMPMIVVTGVNSTGLNIRLMNAGASDYLTKNELDPINFDRILLNNLLRAERYKSLVASSTHDAWTGTFSRQYLLTHLTREMALRNRGVEAGTVLFVDLDGLTEVRDLLGRKAHADFLRQIGKSLYSVIRDVDVIGRWSTNQFVVALHGHSDHASTHISERVIKLLLQLARGVGDVQFTVSVGIAQLHESYENADEWIEKAKEATVDAKAFGGNRYVLVAEV